MPKTNKSKTTPRLLPSHRYVNFSCIVCGKVYSRSIVRRVRCPVSKEHEIGRVWGSKKQNTRFINPDMALFSRSSRIRKPSHHLHDEISQRRLDRFLRQRGFNDLDEDEREDDEDYDYANAANFNPKMRYTKAKGPRRGCRDFSSYKPTYSKSSGEVRVGNAVGRPTSPGSVMGQALGGKAKSAQRWANRGKPYKINRYKSLEWCHLQADSLGGPTSVDNLVAASFAANTEMLVIEHTLKGKTNLGIHVYAHGDSAHVAELIIYEVYRMPLNGKSTKLFEHEIDAANDYFTEDDGTQLADALKQAIK